MERTLVLLKPDAVSRGLIGEIISRFEKKGLKIVALKMIKMDEELAKKHYAKYVDKPFFPVLAKFMTSKPIVAMVVEGLDAIKVVRKIVGKTNGREAEPGTIRGDYGMSISKNLIHASDAEETAKEEISRFFKEEEIIEWKNNEEIIYSEDELW